MTLLSIQNMPIKADEEADGNAMLWAGLMCASGDLSSAAGIKDCQSSDGRMWRSPRRKEHETENSFSRDMTLGFLLYVAASEDYSTFDKWNVYIQHKGKLCTDGTDGRCAITLPIKLQIRRIKSKDPLPWYFWGYLLFAAVTAPFGFELHLIGVHVLLDFLITKKLNTNIGEILNRRQPLNPFFMWLAGKDPTERLAQIRTELRDGLCNQWSWERRDDERAWKDSMGWDIAFMENLAKQFQPWHK